MSEGIKEFLPEQGRIYSGLVLFGLHTIEQGRRSQVAGLYKACSLFKD